MKRRSTGKQFRFELRNGYFPSECVSSVPVVMRVAAIRVNWGFSSIAVPSSLRLIKSWKTSSRDSLVGGARVDLALVFPESCCKKSVK